MNDHNDQRRRPEPDWPTGDDPDGAKSRASGPPAEERTGFWSPLWEEEGGAVDGKGVDGKGVEPPADNKAADEGVTRQVNRPNGGRSGPNAQSGPNGGPARPGPNGGPGGRPPAGRGPNGAPIPPGRPGPANGRGPAGPNGPGPNGPGPNAPGGPTTVMNSPGGPRKPGAPDPAGPTTALPNPNRDQATMAIRQGGRPDPNAEGPTVFMPKPVGQARSEPQLLTHREPELEEGFNDEVDTEADAGPTEEELRKMRKKKIWRRVRRTCYVLAGLMIVGPIVAFFITYQLVDVNNPEDVARDQAKVVTLLYSDGQPMTQIAAAGANRVMLKPEDIPDDVKHAVYAAEDQTFETNSGFDLTGIMRAVWNNVTGGGGGGSTISQQYIKQATGNDDPTLTRKWVEVVKSYKMNKTYDKKYIITAYLNTVYFGRGAYGIAAAAKAYYGVDDLHKLSRPQAALLAGMIQTPAKSKQAAYQHQRYDYVSKRMVENGWMTDQERTSAQFPAPADPTTTKAASLTGARAFLPGMITDELEDLGYSEDRLKQNGYKITTTIDERAQGIAEDSVTTVMKGQPATSHVGLVAVDPNNGGILAYYGGSDPNGVNWAKTQQEPGSSFKPFDLVGLLKKGMGLQKMYDSSPKAFPPGSKHIVKNAAAPKCQQCTVAEAMKESLNVVFSDMVYNDVKPAGTAEAAKEAGITSDLSKALDLNIAIGGGQTRVSVRDMAGAYATFADGGTRRPTHLIAKIQYPDGATAWEASAEPSYAEALAFTPNDPDLNSKIARNVTESLLPIPQSSNIPCSDGRLCAGKTGTHQYMDTPDNAKAWMVGYTPQVSTAVALSAENGQPIRDAVTGKAVYGSGLPGHVWQKFMNEYLKGAPKVNFPRFVAIGDEEPVTDTSDSRPPVTTTPTTPPVTTTTTPPATTTTTPTETTTTTTTTKRTRPQPPTLTTDVPQPGDG
ncbi:transglycosylase domain-containing protein [Actinokineospora inagensis]|uniref:transglycosylase domain-containing protein n=1 Tax=Actinokineospora inagensis TaxID=103730 RepID=UPI0004215617|nr:transglycosylase domain-containing protein [Actinokineospora inagensis]